MLVRPSKFRIGFDKSRTKANMKGLIYGSVVCGRNCYGIASLDTLQRLIVGFSALETVDQIRNNRMPASVYVVVLLCGLADYHKEICTHAKNMYCSPKSVLLSQRFCCP